MIRTYAKPPRDIQVVMIVSHASDIAAAINTVAWAVDPRAGVSYGAGDGWCRIHAQNHADPRDWTPGTQPDPACPSCQRPARTVHVTLTTGDASGSVGVAASLVAPHRCEGYDPAVIREMGWKVKGDDQ